MEINRKYELVGGGGSGLIWEDWGVGVYVCDSGAMRGVPIISSKFPGLFHVFIKL